MGPNPLLPPPPGSESKWRKVGMRIWIRIIIDADPKHCNFLEYGDNPHHFDPVPQRWFARVMSGIFSSPEEPSVDVPRVVWCWWCCGAVVDLAVWAHEHSYERLLPIFNRTISPGKMFSITGMYCVGLATSCRFFVILYCIYIFYYLHSSVDYRYCTSLQVCRRFSQMNDTSVKT